MARVCKLTASAVTNQLRHDFREIKNNSNEEIDAARSAKNYSLLEGVNDYVSARTVYKERLAQVKVYHRADVKTMASWVVTAPADLARSEERRFFETTVEFLQNRYGRENAVAAMVHCDEGGRSHMHFCFIPVCYDKKTGCEKCCANEVLTRQDLRVFHDDFQRWVTASGIQATIKNGATAKNGRNYTVEEIKRGEMPMQRGHRFDCEIEHTYERGQRF